MIFGSFFHVDENAIFAFFWRRRRRKSGFGGGFEAISLRKIPPKIANPHNFRGKILGILENYGEFSKILENAGKFPGNSLEFPEILGNPRDNLEKSRKILKICQK